MQPANNDLFSYLGTIAHGYITVDRDKVPVEQATRIRTETPCLHLGPISSQFRDAWDIE